MVEIKVDNVGLNASYWSEKTEKEFIDDLGAAGNHPPYLSEADKLKWLKSAYAACLSALKVKAPVDKVSTKKVDEK